MIAKRVVGALMCACLAGPAFGQASRTPPPASYVDQIARLRPSVVVLNTRGPDDVASLPPGLEKYFPPARDYDSQGREESGSGFVFDAAKGLIVTTDYMVERATSIEVILANGARREGRVVGFDEVSGVGVIQTAPEGLVNVVWADRAPRQGEPALVLGNAYGLGLFAATGMVANEHAVVGSETEDFFLLDLPTHKGSAGAPVFDANGAVIGMATAQYGVSGSSAYGNAGVAIPAADVRQAATLLARDGTIQRGKIGVVIDDALSEVVIRQVVQGSSAERAGLKEGDIVVRAAGQDVKSRRMLTRLVAAQPIGAQLPVAVKREGKEIAVTLVVEARP